MSKNLALKPACLIYHQHASITSDDEKQSNKLLHVVHTRNALSKVFLSIFKLFFLVKNKMNYPLTIHIKHNKFWTTRKYFSIYINMSGLLVHKYFCQNMYIHYSFRDKMYEH